MTVRDLISPLEQSLQIVFMTVTEEDGTKEICRCRNNSEGVKPYLLREVVSWRVSSLIRIMDDITIVITLGEEI